MSAFTSKTSQDHLTSHTTDSSTDALRKRVCKACDRCRLKKSKCDGTKRCWRCATDNVICIYGERKKAGDKIYPKGYAEMLEQQQELFVHGLQQMYHQLLAAKLWQGSALCEANEDPLAHDILAALGLLRNEGGEIRRRPSFSSNSDHSHHAPSTSHHTPIVAKTHTFKASVFSNDSPSSFTPSSAPKQGQSRRLDHQSPFHQDNLMINDLDLVWSGRAVPNMSNSEAVATSDFKLQSSELYNSIDDITTKQNLIDSPFSEFEFQNFASNQPQTVNDLHLIQNFECGPWDPTIDLNFENFN